MMKNIKLLDCTLRDGGRIIDCKFADRDISDITTRLTDAGINMVEIGFLRDGEKVHYEGNSTFFTDVKQISAFIPANRKDTEYVAFIDYGMFDFDTLSDNDGTSIDGIRVGFTKKNLLSSKEDIIKCLNIVKDSGYDLYIQGVNSLGYTDDEILEIVEFVNQVHPKGFGIVDTYGAMYVSDVRHIFGLVDGNLKKDIAIDFHSHNNFQLSFSLAQEVIELSKGSRNIIIDATLNGMGKCAGNLNTELIVDYLVRKLGYCYDFDSILDIIDEYMYSIKEQCSWGYTIPAMMAGVYKSHPNNVIYLTEKYRLATKDIKHIMSMIDPEVRQRYDYDNIQRLYMEYNHSKIEDKEQIEELRNKLLGRNVLIIMPGSSIVEYRDKIEKYVAENNAFVISGNFISDFADKENRMTFFGSSKRYKLADTKDESVIVVSNVEGYREEDMVINYESLIERDNDDFDNTMIMLLNLLKRIGVRKFAIAGFDGYQKGGVNYFNDGLFQGNRFETKYDSITDNMKMMLKKYVKSLDRKEDVTFLTPSVYEEVFK